MEPQLQLVPCMSVMFTFCCVFGQLHLFRTSCLVVTKHILAGVLHTWCGSMP